MLEKMLTESNIISRANKVFVFDSLEETFLYGQMIETSPNKKNVSVLSIDCKQCRDERQRLSAVCVIQSLFELLMFRTRVGCGKPVAWLKHRHRNTVFEEIVEEVAAAKDFDDLSDLLGHYSEEVVQQIHLLVDIEKNDYVLFIVSCFQDVAVEEQAVLASAIHRLTKSAPAYFHILSVGTPRLFAKSELGEVGIQRDQDYFEVNFDS